MKHLTIIGILLALSGCSMFSGNASEEIALADGKPILNAAKQPIKLKTKQTQAAALGDNAEASLIAVANMESKRLDLEIAKAKNDTGDTCFTVSEAVFNDMQALPKDTYLRMVDKCKTDQRFASVIAMLGDVIANMSKPKSDIALVADSFGTTIRSVAHEGTAKLQSLFSFGTKGIIAIEMGKSDRSRNESFRDIGIAAAENSGDIAVGDISVDNSQHASADSNDGGSGLGGDGMGSGEGGSGTGGSGTGGDGSGVASNTGAPNNTIINIGGDAAIATDDAISQAGTKSTAATEPNSAAIAADGEARTNAAPCVDCGDGDRPTSDNDGNNNGTF